MNRGAGRRPVFLKARDGRRFVALLGEASERFDVEVHAYCLMPNHYHLLLHCPRGGLSVFMQFVGSAYTKYLNWRVDRDGPIFRGRFHSILVDTDAYLAAAGRYIHRNPSELDTVHALEEYPWSSYPRFVTNMPAQPWLHTEVLLDGFASRERYREFVEHDSPIGHRQQLLRWAIDTAVHERSDDLPNLNGVARCVALAMWLSADPALRRRIEAQLDMPSASARAMAMSRARRRLEREPVLGLIADRARHLAA